MNFHILNGDSLHYTFAETQLEGQCIICRECLIDGPVQAKDLDNFWAIRASYLAQTHGEIRERYYDISVRELDKLQHLPAHAEVNLWFEDDLFCQSNMWFILSLLASSRSQLKIYRVFPSEPVQDHWRGFGEADASSLELAFSHRVEFHQADLDLGVHLWEAYRNGNLERLFDLSQTVSPCFKLLPEVVQAHIERFAPEGQLGRPERLIAELMRENPEDFSALFVAFWKKEGIYGFGDGQVRVMYERLLNLGALI